MPFLVIDLTSTKPEQIPAFLKLLEGTGSRVIGRNPGEDPGLYRIGGPHPEQKELPHFAPIIQRYGIPTHVPDVIVDFREYEKSLCLTWKQLRRYLDPETGETKEQVDEDRSWIQSGWVTTCHTDAVRNWKRTLHITNELIGITFKLKLEHWIAGEHAARGNQDHRNYCHMQGAFPTLDGVANDYRVLLSKASPSWTDLPRHLTDDIASLGPWFFSDMLGSVRDALRIAHWEDPTNRLLRTIKRLQDEVARLKGHEDITEGE